MYKSSTIVAFAALAMSASAQYNPSCGSTTKALSMEIGKRCFTLTNDERAKVGAPLLKWNDELHDSVYEHSKDMALGNTAFGHDGFEARANAMSFSYSNAGENVAMNYESADPCLAAVN